MIRYAMTVIRILSTVFSCILVVMDSSFIYTGQLIHSISSATLQFIKNGLLVVKNGVIVDIEETTGNLSEVQQKYEISDNCVFCLSATQFLIPGFVDSHIHGPQYPNSGLGYDLPLLEWLLKYTFPLEMKYSDATFAQTVYQAVVRKTLSCGTTTASYFTTIHADTALLLANEAQKQNQRAFVGKVNMSTSFDAALNETYSETLTATNTFLSSFPASDLVKPIITPRFAISCDMPCMKSLAEIATAKDIHIQTHISENKSEIDLVLKLFPGCSSYTDVYDKAGLLTSKTILAHGVHLSDDEVKVLVKRGTAVSHCPNSNISLQSGMCQVRRLLNLGLKVGLGTDCAGGYSVSMFDAIRQALVTSTAVSFNTPELKKLSLAEVFHMATLGGAQALAIENLTGNFVKGKKFDALLIDVSNMDLLEDYSLEQLFQKLIYLGDDRNVTKVYVNGKLSVDKPKLSEVNQ